MTLPYDIERAVKLIKTGNKTDAQKLLLNILSSDPENEQALLWMTRTVTTVDAQRQYLEKVLTINPNSEPARKALTLIDEQQKTKSAMSSHPHQSPKPLTSETELTELEASTKQCPYCAETIKAAAKVCRYCGRELDKFLEVPHTTKNEKTYFQEGEITITSTRAIIYKHTYSMSNITSVSMTDVPPQGQLTGVILMLLGVMLGLACGLGEQISVGLFIGLPFFIIGGILLFSAKKKYSIRIGSASGESDALTSPKRDYIAKIVEAINQAIVERG